MILTLAKQTKKLYVMIFSLIQNLELQPSSLLYSLEISERKKHWRSLNDRMKALYSKDQLRTCSCFYQQKLVLRFLVVYDHCHRNQSLLSYSYISIVFLPVRVREKERVWRGEKGMWLRNEMYLQLLNVEKGISIYLAIPYKHVRTVYQNKQDIWI